MATEHQANPREMEKSEKEKTSKEDYEKMKCNDRGRVEEKVEREFALVQGEKLAKHLCKSDGSQVTFPSPSQKKKREKKERKFNL